MAAKNNEPWKGLMTKKNYDKATRGMNARDKKDFDKGLAERNTNLLMALRVEKLFDPRKTNHD